MTLFHESLPGRPPREWEPLLLFAPTALPGRPTFPTFSHATKLMGLLLLLLLLSFICSLACLLSGLFLSLFEESPVGKEGTTHREAFRAVTHARRAGEDEPPASPREAANPPLPRPRARQPGGTALPARCEAAAKGLRRLRGPSGPGPGWARLGRTPRAAGLGHRGIRRPSARRG